METNVLTFNNSGFVYDVANPTQQTEELAYILKNALLDTSPLNLYQMDSEEMTTFISRILAYVENPIAPAIDDVNDSLAPLSTLSDTLSLIEASMAELMLVNGQLDQMNVYMESIRDSIAFMQTYFETLNWFFDPENEDSTTVFDLFADLCAASGFFMDSPGKVTIEKIIPPV